MIKHDIHQSPTTIINTRRRRNVVRPHENQRPVDELQPISMGPVRFLQVLVQEESYDGHQSADPEEVQ